jgi:hypothetical protein
MQVNEMPAREIEDGSGTVFRVVVPPKLTINPLPVTVSVERWATE